MITGQLLLGITTLLLAVPVPLGVLHQFTGVLALTAALIATQRAVASRATDTHAQSTLSSRAARASTAAPIEAATPV